MSTTIKAIENRWGGHVVMELSDGTFTTVHRGQHEHLKVGDPWPELPASELKSEEHADRTV